jgi:hypothetical protein
MQPSPAGKKRPAATVEGGNLPSNASSPNIPVPNKEKNPNARARTLPHDYLAKIAKRNSMPDAIQPSIPMPADLNSSPPNSLHLGLNNPAVASPLSQQFEFRPQMGNVQIPDLKNVMFPGDNPFAYPNQPISTLESSHPQFGFQDSGPDSYPGSNEGSMMNTPVSMPSHLSNQNHEQQQQFDMVNMQRLYENNPEIAQQFAQQGRHFGAPMPGLGPQAPNFAGHSQVYDMPGQMSEENYWTQMGKGNMGTRTGFTPGASVNLDELFGGDGWGGMWEQQGLPRN